MVILALVLLLQWKKPALFKKAALAVPLLIIAMEAITLAVITFTSSGAAKKTSTVCYYSSKELFHFAKEGNLIVLVVDSLEGPRLEELLEDETLNADSLFDGFTYYQDVTGVGETTLPSMTKLLTDQLYPVETDQLTAMEQCFSQAAIYDELAASGYRTNLFEYDSFAARADMGKISNLRELSAAPRGKVLVTMTKQLYKLVLYRYAPHYLKRYFMKFGLVFDQEEAAFADQYYVNDLLTWQALRENGVTADLEGKLFSLYHFYGMHSPYRLTRDMAYGDYGEDVPEEERVYEQGAAVVTMLGELLEGLRQAGVYDDATIVITADHGSRSRYRYLPAFLVKFPGERQGLTRSKTPVSLYEQFIPLLRDAASGRAVSQDWFGAGWDSGRERYVFRYDFDDAWEGAARRMEKIAVNGPADDTASYSADLFAK